MTSEYLRPAVRIEAWQGGTQHTLMDTIDGGTSSNFTLSAQVSRHLTDRIGSFNCKIANNNGRWLNTFTGGGDVEIFVDYDSTVDEDLTNNISQYWNFNNNYFNSIGNSIFVNNVVCFLPFIGNTNDSSSKDNDATNYNATLTSDRLSVSNRAYDFNGTNAYMTHTTTGIDSDKGSIFIWFNPDVLTEGSVIYSNSQTAGNKFVIGIKSNKLWYQIGNMSSTLGDTVLTTSVWHCVVLTWDNGTVHIYLDGTEDDDSQTASLTSIESTHYIGCDSSISNFFNGKIDEVLILDEPLDGDYMLDLFITYSGSDLTYNAGTSMARTINAVAYYPFNSDLLDYSTNSYNLYQNTNLIAHYKMNDDGVTKTIIDSRSGYDGYAQQYASTISTTGKINDAITFNGVSDYVSIKATTSSMLFPFTATTACTVKHNLNSKYPYFTVIDTTGKYVEPEVVTMTGVNQFSVEFGSAISGNVRVHKTDVLADPASTYSYLHEQTVSTSVWTVTHNENNSYPNFQVFDVNDNAVEPESVTIDSSNQFTVNIGTTSTGKVRAVSSIRNTYLHTQAVASSAWNVVHNLNDSYPFVQVFGADGTPMETEEISVTNSNNLALELGISTSGFVRVITNDDTKLAKGLETNDFTFTTWVKSVAPVSTSAILSIFPQFTLGIGFEKLTRFTLGIRANGKPFIQTCTPSDNFSFGTTNICDGNYHHLALDYNKTSGACNLYVDNTTTDISSTISLSIATTDFCSLGQHYNLGGYPSFFYEGAIDDTRFYDAILLADERSRIYNSGNGSEAENLDGPQSTTGRFNEADTAYAYDGSNDYSSYVSGFPVYTNNFTVLSWVKDTQSDTGAIIGNQWYLYADSANSNKLRFYDGATSYPAASFDPLITGGTTSGWHQVGFEIDDGNFYYIQDGDRSSIIHTGCSLTWSGSDLYIGNNKALTNNFKGIIDETIILGTTVSEAEIEDYYNYTNTRDLISPFTSGLLQESMTISGIGDSLSASVSISGTTATMSTWLKDVHTGLGDYLISSDASAATYIQVVSDNVIKITKGNTVIINNLTLTSGIYNHIVIIWRNNAGQEQAKVYLNNVAQTGWVNFTGNTTGTYLSLGSKTSAGSFYAGGEVDELGIWNAVLTDDEISLLYKSGVGLPYEDFDLRGNLIFKGKIDNVMYGVNSGDGFFIDLEGRDYPRIVDRTITGAHIAALASDSLGQILYNFFNDVKIAFWTGTTWSIGTYNGTIIVWSIAVPTFPSTLINTRYEHKKAWSVIKDICDTVGLDVYLDYDKVLAQWYLRLFLPETVLQYRESAKYGTNIVTMNEYGVDNTELVNRAIVYGKQESDNILLLKTEQSTTSQSDWWIKDKLIRDGDLTTMENVQSRADSELSIGLDTPASGRINVIGMPLIRPGHMIPVTVANCGISGRHKINSFTHNINDNTFMTNLELSKKINTIKDIFVPKVDPDSFTSGFSNPNDMTDSYTIYFNETPTKILTSAVTVDDGKIRLRAGATSGYIIASAHTADFNVTECELRRYENFETASDIYSVSNIGTGAFETYNALTGSTHTFATVGNSLSFRIELHRTSSTAVSPAYESLSMIYKA